jgi:hypothetical protein
MKIKVNDVRKRERNTVGKYVHECITGLCLSTLGWLNWTHFMTSKFPSYKVFL